MILLSEDKGAVTAKVADPELIAESFALPGIPKGTPKDGLSKSDGLLAYQKDILALKAQLRAYQDLVFHLQSELESNRPPF